MVPFAAFSLELVAQIHAGVRVLPVLVDDPDVHADQLSNFEVVDEDFQTIKVQLRALGLIAKSEKNRSVKDTQGYWTLTPFGDHVMNQLRAITRGSVAADESSSESEASAEDADDND